MLLIISDEFNIEPQFFYGTATDGYFPAQWLEIILYQDLLLEE